MKKLLSIVLALAMLLTLTTVAASAETADEGTWKVAILTGTTSQGEEEFRAAEKALEKYGPEHIITDTPILEDMMTPTAQIAVDPADWRNTSFCEYYGENCTIAFGTEPLEQ